MLLAALMAPVAGELAFAGEGSCEKKVTGRRRE